MDLKKVFDNHLAQTNDFLPVQLDIVSANGIYLTDLSGKQYIDLISGVAVNNLGHRHPAIISAIEKQLNKYLHLMVYGEYLQEETLCLAKKLADILPEELSVSFFVNSGSEAVEGALKLSRLFTGRLEVISFKGSYHGSTLGTLNLLGDEKFKRPFRPLIPKFRQLEFNRMDEIEQISDKTACIIVEPIQTACGMRVAEADFLKKIRNKCNETGSLLIYDEIQTALGRTGKMFAFESFGVQPDVLCLAKSLGGGLPIGAFISSPQIMNSLNNGHPLLGHATTFGGNPLCCATALATLKVLEQGSYIQDVLAKETLFRDLLQHKLIQKIEGKGLLLSVDLGDENTCRQFVEKAIPNGIITYWFLFNKNAFAIIPPLTISFDEISEACNIMLKILNEISFCNS